MTIRIDLRKKTECYRILNLAGEILGVAVGFMPDIPHQIRQNYIINGPYEVIIDTGGDQYEDLNGMVHNVFFIPYHVNSAKPAVAIAIADEIVGMDGSIILPESLDTDVWRSQEDLVEWVKFGL